MYQFNVRQRNTYFVSVITTFTSFCAQMPPQGKLVQHVATRGVKEQLLIAHPINGKPPIKVQPTPIAH